MPPSWNETPGVDIQGLSGGYIWNPSPMNNITDDPKAVTKFACRSNPGCNQAVTYATGTGGQAAGYIQRQGDAPRRGVARTGWTGLALSGDRAPNYKSKLIRPTSGPKTLND